MAESPIPDISVIIPVLDNEDGLRACVHALQQQSLPSERFEIIVVDNGSEDGTLEAAGELPVRLFSQVEPKTPYAARNRGLKEARGRIIAFTDSLCIPDRQWLENGLKRLERDRKSTRLNSSHVAISYAVFCLKKKKKKGKTK